jgi:hypothetical protein
MPQSPIGLPQSAVEELPGAQIAPSKSDPFENDARPNSEPIGPVPGLKSTPVPRPASSFLEPKRLPNPGGGGSFGGDGESFTPAWTGDLDLKSLDDSRLHACAPKNQASSSARRPLLESSVSEDEVSRRRSFVDQTATK